MKFSFWPGSNNSWENTVLLCQHAERSGWDGIWFADHLMPAAGTPTSPIAEAWTTMAGLAAVVPRVRIGSLVTANTFRNPALLAKMAVNVDIISGGRLVLGLGGGWQENEHHAYDIPFPPTAERLHRLAETVQIIQQLFSQKSTSFDGTYYTVRDAPLSPRPVQDPVPILVGGNGEKLTLRIVAEFANEWNTWGLAPHLKQKGDVLDRHCENIGRDPATIRRSAIAMLVHSDDPSKVDRIRATGRPTLGGTTDEVQHEIEAYRTAGVSEVVIPDFNLGRSPEAKMATMDRFMEEVASAFR